MLVSFMLVILASDWQLLTGGRYSEVVVRTGLTVFTVFMTLQPVRYLTDKVTQLQ
jgi:hypothetical protein